MLHTDEESKEGTGHMERKSKPAVVELFNDSGQVLLVFQVLFSRLVSVVIVVIFKLICGITVEAIIMAANIFADVQRV